jgi:FtsH-binding integral membrane protein
MCDESGNWNDLSQLWHAANGAPASREVERRERRQRHIMLWLRFAEGAALTLAFIAAMWIAMQTAYVAMTALSIVFFGTCGYLQYRMRREPQPLGGEDLLTSLGASVQREEWNLAQLGAGRAVTLLTLAAISMVVFDHLRHYASTPPGRLGALLAIAGIVFAILAWNVVLTVRARRRKRLLEAISQQLGGA